MIHDSIFGRKKILLYDATTRFHFRCNNKKGKFSVWMPVPTYCHLQNRIGVQSSTSADPLQCSSAEDIRLPGGTLCDKCPLPQRVVYRELVATHPLLLCSDRRGGSDLFGTFGNISGPHMFFDVFRENLTIYVALEHSVRVVIFFPACKVGSWRGLNFIWAWWWYGKSSSKGIIFGPNPQTLRYIIGYMNEGWNYHIHG